MLSRGILELTIIGVSIVVITIISFFFKGKSRKIGWVFALVTFVACCIFIVARPYWIDSKIEKKVKILRSYLEEHYPDEKWTVSTVDHRDPKNKHESPYTIAVTFKSEPDVTYDYQVKSKDNINQFGFSSTTGKTPSDCKHRKE